MAMFSAMVELGVKHTWSGRRQPNSPASFSRRPYTVLAAARASGWTPRPQLPQPSIAAVTASATPGGLGRVVAALSR